MKQIAHICLAACMLLLFSCGRTAAKKEEIIPEKTLAELLVDMHLADARLYIEDISAEAKKEKALAWYPSVLEKYGVTGAQVDSSVSWYMKRPQVYTRITQKVVKTLEKMLEEEKSKAATRDTTGETE